MLEPLEPRFLLDVAPVSLEDDMFDARQNSSAAELDVLANDDFDEAYEGQRRITSSSYGSEGGTVDIASDGLSILYAPPADFFGSETFIYVVDVENTAQVHVQAPLTSDEY